MPNLSDIVSVIETLAPPALAADWDNTGLQVGDPGSEVGGVLVALDPTPAVIEEAAGLGCGLVVAHHPLFFGPVRRLDTSAGVGRAAALAVRLGVAVYSAHTSLDRVPGGVSGALAARLGLGRTRVLEQAGGWPRGYGFGAVGELPKKITAGAFAGMVKKALGAGAVRLVGDRARRVRTVAVCGGSGSELMGAADDAGADAYVTGDIKYHDALAALEMGLVVIDAGHYRTELPVVGSFAGTLGKALGKRRSKVKVHTSSIQAEPWEHA